MLKSQTFCFPKDVKERNSTTNKEDEMQEYQKRILQYVPAEKIIPMDLKNSLLFHFLKPEFISQIHMVLVYDDNEAIIVTKDKNVYSLSYSDPDDLHTAIYPKKIKELCGKNIKTLAHSNFFILALTEEGEVYYWEFESWNLWDTYDSSGTYVPDEHIKISTPTLVPNLSEKRIVDIACGRGHSLALTSDGKVKHELENKNVVYIACDLLCNIVITDKNEIYSWGENDRNKMRNNASHCCPLRIIICSTIWDKIVKVTCGYDHTLVLTNKGDIYAWGSNHFGQIGQYDYYFIKFPEISKVNVPEMGKVLDIAALRFSSVAVGYDGTIYVWGELVYKYNDSNYNDSYLVYNYNGSKRHSKTPLPTKFSRIHDFLHAYNGWKMIYKPLTLFTNDYKYVEEVLNILESIGAAFDDPLTSDFIIQVEGQSIYVHKFILRIRCEYFKKMFQHDWSENIRSKSASLLMFTVRDKFSYIVYKAFLKYLYTGTIDLPSENALELMELADMYCEPNLKKYCIQVIKQDITLSNVAFFYDEAVVYNAKELEEFCFQFILRHMTANTLLEDIKLDMNMQAKFMQIAATQSRDTIVSISSKKSCSPEAVEKRNSETTTNIKNKMQKYEKRILQSILAERILMDLKNWPFFWLLKLEFILQIHMIMIFQQNGKAIIVTKDKNVYSFDYSSEFDDTHTTYLKKINELCGKNIKTFAHNHFLILALTEEGEVYSCNFIENKRDVSIPEESTFTQVASLREKYILDIACGYRHSLALTSDGKVYAWGENNWQNKGQINDEKIVTFISTPCQVKHELENKNVVYIACGPSFNIVITDKNEIYGWGNNDSCQISTVQSDKYYRCPRKIITISNKIVKLACGSDHTLALTNEGEIYAWGDNFYGQIGVKKLRHSGPIMVNVPEMGKVLDIAAFRNLSVAVGHNRIVYIWGKFAPDVNRINSPFPTKFSTIHDMFAYSNLDTVMYKPLTVFTNIEEILNILESVEAAFDDPLSNDFTIQVGPPIYVHKAILKIRCDYFKKMFQHDRAENIQSISDLSSVFTVSDKFSYIVYKAFLKYLYTGTIDLPSENAFDLLELANNYCEANLIKDCSQIIKKTITVSNVIFSYNKAIEYNAKELEEFCFQFALLHMTDVVLSEDYIKLDINIKDNFIRKAAKENAFRT
ncbi:uncharacterized protein LOC105249500 isoform X2 [Camponotus floridanus]|uniref:uncharacterized protein LOC105249500 isoform X2 n=1 Tax=Camponotus floridanus TaxID=104421 RepID=UPI000DC664BA|nr:uncharacterized protein LOC105249500 isoform X2 [Camponotus floridanus]